MKVGDLVRLKKPVPQRYPLGIVVSEIRHGVNNSFVDVLIKGQVIPVNWTALEVISEGR